MLTLLVGNGAYPKSRESMIKDSPGNLFVSRMSVPHTAAFGPPVVADTAINLLTPTGEKLRTDSEQEFARVSDSTNAAPELYYAYSATSAATSQALIRPGGAIILKSKHTKKYCQLAAITNSVANVLSVARKSRSSSAGFKPKDSTGLVPDACATQGMLCNLATNASATPFVYTGKRLNSPAGSRRSTLLHPARRSQVPSPA